MQTIDQLSQDEINFLAKNLTPHLPQLKAAEEARQAAQFVANKAVQNLQSLYQEFENRRIENSTLTDDELNYLSIQKSPK